MKEFMDFLSAALPWICLGLLLAVFLAKNASNKKGSRAEENYATEGLALGMCFGTAIGTSLGGNTGIGLTLGMLAGFVIGSNIKKKSGDSDEIIIKTQRLNIYPASVGQMERLTENAASPELKEAYKEMLDGCLAHPDQWMWYAAWSIELNDGSKTVVGDLCFKGIDENGTVEIGYGMNAEYEGRGFMTEAVKAVVGWASAQKGVCRIEAEVEEDNAASKRVLEKAGFVPNGKTGEEGPRYVWKG